MTSLPLPEVADTAEGYVPFLEQMAKNKVYMEDVLKYLQQKDPETARIVSVVFNNMTCLADRLYTVLHYDDSSDDNCFNDGRPAVQPDPARSAALSKLSDEAHEHLWDPLTAAYDRLQPRTYRRIASLHILWDTAEDIQLFEPGLLALKDLFSRYGFSTRYEKLDTVVYNNTLNHATLRFSRILEHYKDFGPDDLLIIHYRGHSSLAWDGILGDQREVRLRPSSSSCVGSRFINIPFPNALCDGAMPCAQVVHLLDCDYPVDHLDADNIPSYSRRDCCDAVLARSSSSREWGKRGAVVDLTDVAHNRHDFNDLLIQELEGALNRERYHTLSSLYSAIQAVKPNVFATRAYFKNGRTYSGEYVHEVKTPFFHPVPWDHSKDDICGVLRHAVAPSSTPHDLINYDVKLPCFQEGLSEHIPNLLGHFEEWLCDLPFGETPGWERAPLVQLHDRDVSPRVLQVRIHPALLHCLPILEVWTLSKPRSEDLPDVERLTIGAVSPSEEA